MFNKNRIENLERKIRWMEEDRRELSNQIWALEKDLAKLTKYLGLEFQDGKRSLVAVDKFEKFKQ